MPLTMDGRATFGWESPNEAAALIAMLLPLGWALLVLARGMPPNRRWTGPFLAAMGFVTVVVLWFGLALTGSRSGAISATVAGIGFAGLVVRCRIVPWQVAGIAVVGNLMVFAIALFLTGKDSRFAAETVTTDRSAEIRLDLWAAGLRMVAEEPLSGWGTGQSGLHYMHWFQDPADPKRVAGMIQSYLHIGVEHGLPALFLFLCILLAGVVGAYGWAVGAWTAGRTRVALIGCSAWAIGVAWAVANGFSTLWILRDLWYLPLATSVLAWVRLFRLERGTHRGIRLAGFTALLALAITLTLWGAGKGIVHAPLVSTTDQFIRLSNQQPHHGAADATGVWTVYPDAKVLGPDFGRHLREWMHAAGMDALQVVKNPQDPAVPTPRGPVLVMGRWANRVARVDSKSPVWIVHPTIRPDDLADLRGPQVHLVLPDLDPVGHSGAWKRIARTQGWTLHSSGWVGIDLRPSWPEVMGPTMDGFVGLSAKLRNLGYGLCQCERPYRAHEKSGTHDGCRFESRS